MEVIFNSVGVEESGIFGLFYTYITPLEFSFYQLKNSSTQSHARENNNT
ncbi:hypothetical protein EZS27_000927 [termite gut metagenome]|uniref:Uncharacterized protein n=1 Tax=termite gut metagenome TaxID=433724 RepID=A0A5J4T1Q5_9ZZZZ